MTIRNLFLAYMALVGLASGALIVAAPQFTEFWLKPYFWLLLAVALFDTALFLIGRSSPITLLPMNARGIGFIIGAVLMVAIPTVAGTQAAFF